MKAYAVVLIVSGSAIAAILVLISFYKRGRKKHTEHPVSAKKKANTLPSNGYHDAAEGLTVDTGGRAKNAALHFSAGAALAAVTSLSSEGEDGFTNSYGRDNATSSGVDGGSGGGSNGGGGAGCGSG